MSKQKKNGKQTDSTDKLLLLTAILKLVKVLIELFKTLIE